MFHSPSYHLRIFLTETIPRSQLPLRKPFNTWLEQAQEDLQDMFIVNKVDDIMALVNGHENFKKTLPTAENEMREMLSEARQVQDIVRQHNLPPDYIVNPYTMIDFQVCNELLVIVYTNGFYTSILRRHWDQIYV
ncbi:hypothetical protein AHF37_08267 [Paragonimus kellicotti]|nr:hypothetical protein AHF37_08267 [Paragonimus kellicotti]